MPCGFAISTITRVILMRQPRLAAERDAAQRTLGGEADPEIVEEARVKLSRRLRTRVCAISRAQTRANITMRELRPSGSRLGKDFLRLLLKYIHGADVWDWTVANARDAQLGETFIRGHAVHNHNIHR